MIHVTRKMQFNAAHKLYNENWTKEKNNEVFGVCANENWHGHNFNLYITIKGEIDPETGFVLDLKELKQIIQESVIIKLDHKNLNLDVPFMKGKMASTENLAIGIWNELEKKLKRDNCSLYKVDLIETEHNSVQYYGN